MIQAILRFTSTRITAASQHELHSVKSQRLIRRWIGGTWAKTLRTMEGT